MSELSKIFVSDLSDKQSFQTTFLAKNKSLLKDKKGNSYMSLLLSDASGDIDARAWDNVERYGESFHSGDIVEVKGIVQVYQNRKQIVVHKVEAFQGDVDLKDYLGATKESPEALYQQLLELVDQLTSEHLKQLILSVLTDPSLKPLILMAPAAKSIHHAKQGGLLEHIVSIGKLCFQVQAHYTHLNKDLLLFGAIFHDIGKIWELEITPTGIRYTDKGRLIGHLVMAVELVEKKASQIFNFPEDLKDICKHIVLGHHGKLEYGSPQLPKTPEAYVVWMLDYLDSKLDSMGSAMKRVDESGDWSVYSQLFERHFYLKTPKWD